MQTLNESINYLESILNENSTNGTIEVPSQIKINIEFMKTDLAKAYDCLIASQASEDPRNLLNQALVYLKRFDSIPGNSTVNINAYRSAKTYIYSLIRRNTIAMSHRKIKYDKEIRQEINDIQYSITNQREKIFNNIKNFDNYLRDHKQN